MEPMESRARPHEAAATVTTTVEQRVSDNRVTGHHAWDRVCVNSVAAKLNQQNRNAGRVEWSSGAVEQPSQAVEQPSGAAERQTSGRATTSKRRATGQRPRPEETGQRRISDRAETDEQTDQRRTSDRPVRDQRRTNRQRRWRTNGRATDRSATTTRADRRAMHAWQINGRPTTGQRRADRRAAEEQAYERCTTNARADMDERTGQ